MRTIHFQRVNQREIRQFQLGTIISHTQIPSGGGAKTEQNWRKTNAKLILCATYCSSLAVKRLILCVVRHIFYCKIIMSVLGLSQ